MLLVLSLLVLICNYWSPYVNIGPISENFGERNINKKILKSLKSLKILKIPGDLTYGLIWDLNSHYFLF